MKKSEDSSFKNSESRFVYANRVIWMNLPVVNTKGKSKLPQVSHSISVAS